MGIMVKGIGKEKIWSDKCISVFERERVWKGMQSLFFIRQFIQPGCVCRGCMLFENSVVNTLHNFHPKPTQSLSLWRAYQGGKQPLMRDGWYEDGADLGFARAPQRM
jgi:hypothetical protein